jgi:hypothetical protein
VLYFLFIPLTWSIIESGQRTPSCSVTPSLPWDRRSFLDLNEFVEKKTKRDCLEMLTGRGIFADILNVNGHKFRECSIMQHDNYSLEVCLLEIWLWSSLVEIRQDWSAVVPITHGFGGETINELDYSEHIKSSLLRLASKELPGKMGTEYARIVESCFTCLDLVNEDFVEDHELQEDSVIIALGYINKVFIHDMRGLM